MHKVTYTHQIYEWMLIIKFDWEFTNENVPDLFEEVSKTIKEANIYNIIFDMQNIETINSRTAWWFARIYEETDVFWWIIYITNMNLFIDDTLDLLWMFLFLKKTKTNEEAIKWILNK